jgi:hypothetical protein
MKILQATLLSLIVYSTNGFGIQTTAAHFQNMAKEAQKAVTLPLLLVTLAAGPAMAIGESGDQGATSMANAKITTGGASTLQSGRTIGTLVVLM